MSSLRNAFRVILVLSIQFAKFSLSNKRGSEKRDRINSYKGSLPGVEKCYQLETLLRDHPSQLVRQR